MTHTADLADSHRRADVRGIVARAAAVSSFLLLIWTVIVLLNEQPLSPPAPMAGGAALLLAASSIACSPRGRRGAALTWTRARLEAFAPVFGIAAAVIVLWVGLKFGARAAGGADAFGYVSESFLWLKGQLQVPQPLGAEVPWPNADGSLAPLGYRAGATPHTMVPTYSAGVPMVMALFVAAFGVCGPYFVTPWFGCALVLATCGLAIRLSGDRLAGALAAVFMAASPAFLFNYLVPWSDTAAAATWTAALLALTWTSRPAAALAGALAGLATLIRPNLAPLAGACVLALWMWPPAGSARRGPRLLLFLAAFLPAVIFVAVLNTRLYGSPLMSGYGSMKTFYALANGAVNLRLYTGWFVESETIAIVAGLVAPLVLRPRPTWETLRILVPAALVIAIVGVSYLFYLPFDAWWYLRFILPAFPLLLMPAAIGLARLSRLCPAAVALPGLVAVVGLLCHAWLGFIGGRDIFNVAPGEQRYVVVGEYINRALPANAVILGMQHSGTARLYSGRMTIRYDFLPRNRLRSVLDWLDAHGYRPYIVLEEWEEAQFRERFGATDAAGRLEIPMIARTRQSIPVHLYDPLAPIDEGRGPEWISLIPSRPCPVPRGPWSLSSR